MNNPKKENVPPSASTAANKNTSAGSSKPPWCKDPLAGSMSSLAVDNPEDENLPLIMSLAPREATTSSSPGTYPRHVKLPFDLRDPSVKLEGQVIRTLLTVFPGTTNIVISICRAYIHFTVETLPSVPLPLTVAGLPITIGESKGSPGRGKGPMFPVSTMGNLKIRICQDFDGRAQSISSTSSCRNLANTVIRSLFTHSPHLPVVEIIFDAEKNFHIILRDDIDIRSTCHELPGNIAGCWAMYLNEKEMCRPKRRQASRAMLPDPAQGAVDDTPYETLRPGVAISSPMSVNHRQSLTTTSGVMVKNIAGDCFMTAASHGIRDCRRLFQAQTVGEPKEIGEAVTEISFTDVALVQLRNGIDFINTPFDQEGEQVPSLTRLLGEVADDQIDMRLEVSLNSPFIGVIVGVVAALSFKMELVPPVHPTEDAMRYNIFIWSWAGQNTTCTQPRVPDSVCGSAIWDSNGRVIGFFQFYIEEGPWTGFYASVSADEVVRAGYRLV